VHLMTWRALSISPYMKQMADAGNTEAQYSVVWRSSFTV